MLVFTLVLDWIICLLLLVSLVLVEEWYNIGRDEMVYGIGFGIYKNGKCHVSICKKKFTTQKIDLVSTKSTTFYHSKYQ